MMSHCFVHAASLPGLVHLPEVLWELSGVTEWCGIVVHQSTPELLDLVGGRVVRDVKT